MKGSGKNKNITLRVTASTVAEPSASVVFQPCPLAFDVLTDRLQKRPGGAIGQLGDNIDGIGTLGDAHAGPSHPATDVRGGTDVLFGLTRVVASGD